ncbi:hypothetical protein COOONC_09464 [Cooperia oncophora]
MFVHIDMPIQDSKSRSRSSDTGLHRAKIVHVPMVSDSSDSQGSDTPISRSPFYVDRGCDNLPCQDGAVRQKRAKRVQKTEELGKSVDLSDEKRRYY